MTAVSLPINFDAGLAQTMDGMAMTDCETGIVTDDGMSDALFSAERCRREQSAP